MSNLLFEQVEFLTQRRKERKGDPAENPESGEQRGAPIALLNEQASPSRSAPP